jgi:ceramide glucosyltransferase
MSLNRNGSKYVMIDKIVIGISNMQSLFSLLQWICLIPTIGGSIYGMLCLLAVFRFRTQPPGQRQYSFSDWPPVTILKPVHGLEKKQRENFRSACLQDYPQYEVVFCVQDSQDPVLPILKEIEEEFGTERVTITIGDRQVGPNGKINNLLGGLFRARHDILVISDSDVHLKPDYLKSIVAPLADPEVGCVCTLYKATSADRWFEKMELLTFNADFIPSVIFAHTTGASNFCLGPSMALHRFTLEAIGGLESLVDYLVEDYEVGRRLLVSGKKVALVRHFIDIVVDLKNPSQWWAHQIYWDQNTRVARPIGFLATILIRSVPFSLLYGMLRSADTMGLAVFGMAIGLRLITAAFMMGWGFQDHEGLRDIALLPLRDMVGLITWLLAFTKRTLIWRGSEYILTRDGRLVPLRFQP